jgi:nitrogen regulatory protein P-II 1
MVKLEAIIQPFKIDDIKAALEGLGIETIMISYVLEHGGVTGPRAYYRGAEYLVDVPMVKLKVLISSLQTEEVIDTLLHAASTTASGDNGRILVSEIAEAISVPSGQRLRFTVA